jgi:hypothetical protein
VLDRGVHYSSAAVMEEVDSLWRRYAFGAGLDLDLLDFEIDDSTLVPGVAVESSRAKPLAGEFPTENFLVSAPVQMLLHSVVDGKVGDRSDFAGVVNLTIVLN